MQCCCDTGRCWASGQIAEMCPVRGSDEYRRLCIEGVPHGTGNGGFPHGGFPNGGGYPNGGGNGHGYSYGYKLNPNGPNGNGHHGNGGGIGGGGIGGGGQGGGGNGFGGNGGGRNIGELVRPQQVSIGSCCIISLWF
uniref:TB domain-containing protein n=1 Tax=Hucho hucho TaxID=62062 RepID=A0A4W5MXD3_9TELE